MIRVTAYMIPHRLTRVNPNVLKNLTVCHPGCVSEPARVTLITRKASPLDRVLAIM
jgi:hypothetical protein